MTGIRKIRENLETDIYTRRTLCEDEGRDQGGALHPKGWLRLTAKHQKLREKMEQILPHSPQKDPILLTP